ncbi:MAG: hypothetical protein ABI867_11175 [Kofleriaceae bacterium]
MKATLFALLVLAACKDTSGTEPFETYQLCFDEQTEKQLKPVVDSLVECCLEHAIDGVKPVCKDTMPDCINYLTANVLQTDASTTEISEGCTEYLAELEMQSEE